MCLTKKQYAILRRLKERGYHVPVPRKVTVTMESADARMVRSAEKGAAQLRTVLAKKGGIVSRGGKAYEDLGGTDP